jgi:hypothetical protein
MNGRKKVRVLCTIHLREEFILAFGGKGRLAVDHKVSGVFIPLLLSLEESYTKHGTRSARPEGISVIIPVRRWSWLSLLVMLCQDELVV